MTAKEKANEMFCDYFRTGHNIVYEVEKAYAKRNSMLCVDEILKNSRSSIPILIPSNELVCSPEYWQEVKQEIKKI